ncbi:PBP1A family penicillin-binding protein [bacterium]|nr:PBP1A family penicillin-binding protein [candidate division CSSED10-310 bacterium]
MRSIFSLVFRFSVKLGLTIAIGIGSGSVLAVYFHYARQLPELSQALDYRPPLISSIFDRKGNLLANFAKERRILVPLSQIPELMQNAIIAIEDEHFYSHHGIDFPGIMRAAWKNFMAGEIVQGGSTITQQLAKSLFLTRERTVSRKIKEALLAIQLENALTKSRILELYLNQVYFGSGAYGIESAARTYFNKSCSELTLSEAALLAGLPKAPSRFSPLRDHDPAVSRRNTVLHRMAVNNYIPAETAQKAMTEEILLDPSPRLENKAPYFVEVLRRTMEDEFGPDYIYNEGLSIHTTLDLGYQTIGEIQVREGLDRVDRKRGWRGPSNTIELADEPPVIGRLTGARVLNVGRDRLTLDIGGLETTLLFKNIWVKNRDLIQLKPGDRVGCIVEAYESGGGNLKIESCRLAQEPQVEGSLVSIDPATGEILAWVGGYDFSRSQFDRVSQSRRQPGSAFKPFIYATALNGRFTASDIIYDSPIIIEKTWEISPEMEESETDPNAVEETEKEYWKPHNYSEEFFGATTMRVGLAKSRNIISIHLLEAIGVSDVIRIASKLGIQSPLSPTLSLALGASEVTLLELTRAYGGFATLGMAAEPMMVRQIVDRDGYVVKEYYPVVRRALDDKTAYLTTFLLQGVIQHGTGFAARSLNRPIGGKTGTTNNYHDAWFIGFSPQIVTGTWVGMDMLESIYPRATGASAALPIWMGFMEKVLPDYDIRDFQMPPGIVLFDVCMDTGQLATEQCETVINEAFLEGREPVQYCEKHRPISRTTKIGIGLDWDKLEVEESTAPVVDLEQLAP